MEKFKKQRKNAPQNKKGKPKNLAKKVEDKLEVSDSEMAYGFHSVKEVLQEGKVNKLFLQEDGKGQNFSEMKELAQEKQVPVKWVPKTKLDQMTDGAVHQGFVAGTTPYEYYTLEKLLETAKEEAFFVVLDGLQDPHNLGSILRSADATGVDGIIIPKHRAVGVTGTVVKTSTGAVEHVPICRVTNLSQTLKTLKEKGFWTFGTDMAGKDFKTWEPTGKIALVIGNEGSGMSLAVKKEVDEMLTIPMTGHVQSLNASVAAAILMYEAFSKRSLS